MPPDRDLDRELQDLGLHVEYPPAPDLARSVRDRLEAEEVGTGSSARARPQLWWIAVAALVLLVAVPVFVSTLNNLGGAFSGGASGGAAGGAAESGGREDAAGVAEPSVAMESGASAASTGGACFSPESTLEVKPARGAPGDEFGIRGRYFDGNLRDCDNDPARDVRIEFVQDGRTWDLGRLVSDKDSRLAARFEVPQEARPGRATVHATFGEGPPQSPYGRTSAETRFSVLE